MESVPKSAVTEENKTMFSEAMFNEAVAYIIKHVSAWNKLSPVEKTGYKNAAHRQCITEIDNGTEPAMAFADAVFKLLKSIGCSSKEASSIWESTIMHSFSVVNSPEKSNLKDKPKLKAV